VPVRFLVADLSESWQLGGPYGFFFDCGCYGAVRRQSGRTDYLHTLARIVRPGALGLLLVGNAREPEEEQGPPVLTAAQLRADFRGLFEVVRLRECRFDAADAHARKYLAWSCLLRKRA
jgi:methyl halide transferase